MRLRQRSPVHGQRRLWMRLRATAVRSATAVSCAATGSVSMPKLLLLARTPAHNDGRRQNVPHALTFSGQHGVIRSRPVLLFAFQHFIVEVNLRLGRPLHARLRLNRRRLSACGAPRVPAACRTSRYRAKLRGPTQFLRNSSPRHPAKSLPSKIHGFNFSSPPLPPAPRVSQSAASSKGDVPDREAIGVSRRSLVRSEATSRW